MATQVEEGSGQTPRQIDYRYRLSRNASRGTFEVNLKDLHYTEMRDVFFRSSRFELGGYEWELKLEFDMNFVFLRFLGQGCWRLGTKQCLEGFWSASKQYLWQNWCRVVLWFQRWVASCRGGWARLCTLYSYLLSLGTLICLAEGTDRDIIVSNGSNSENWLMRYVTAALSVRSFFFLVYLAGVAVCLLVILLTGTAVLAVFVCLIITVGGLSFTALMAVWTPLNLLFFLSYSLTLPIWATIPTLSSKLKLKSQGEAHVQCKASVTRDHPPFLGARGRLSHNSTLETRGFANANCLKTARRSRTSRWTTIRLEIKLEEESCTEVTIVPQRHELHDLSSPAASETESWNPSVCNEAKPLCIVCLAQPQTSGFVHQHTVHVCMCESCVKKYSAQGSTSCPICRSEIEHVIYKIY